MANDGAGKLNPPLQPLSTYLYVPDGSICRTFDFWDTLRAVRRRCKNCEPVYEPVY